MEQTEEWYKVHGTGNGTGGCRVSASSGTDDIRGHMTGWRYCTLSSSTSSLDLPLPRFYKDEAQFKSIQYDNTFYVAPDSSILSASKTLVGCSFPTRERTAQIHWT